MSQQLIFIINKVSYYGTLTSNLLVNSHHKKITIMEFRIETDTMGEVKVPANVYWGAQTERSRNNRS